VYILFYFFNTGYLKRYSIKLNLIVYTETQDIW